LAPTRAFLDRQRAVHLARMRELVAIQDAITDAAGQIALDHTVFHLDADLRWLEAAAERVAGKPGQKERGPSKGRSMVKERGA
jgi:hypothetical protein